MLIEPELVTNVPTASTPTGACPKYKFPVAVEVAFPESVIRVPSTIEATVVPSGTFGPNTGCPTNKPTVLCTVAVLEALVSIVRRELADGAAKLTVEGVPLIAAERVTCVPLMAVTYELAAIPVPVTVCPTTRPIEPPTPKGATVNTVELMEPTVTPLKSAAGANTNRADPLVATVPESVATPPVTSSTVNVPDPRAAVELVPSVTVIPGSTNAPVGSVIWLPPAVSVWPASTCPTCNPNAPGVLAVTAFDVPLIAICVDDKIAVITFPRPIPQLAVAGTAIPTAKPEVVESVATVAPAVIALEIFTTGDTPRLSCPVPPFTRLTAP